MSDLKLIIHTEDDGDPGNDKYPGQPSLSGSARGPHPSATWTNPETRRSDEDSQPSNSGLSKARPERRGSSSRSSRTTAITTSSNKATTSTQRPSSPPSFSRSSRSPLVERSTADSTGSMDSHGYGSYGHGPSPSTMPPTSRSNTSSRLVSNTSGESSSPVKLTPITGRVSRAKKGVRVHVCDKCNPPKTFTRAEHLRRHQLSHRPASHACPYPGCDKVFHRQDLLTRHIQRHEQDDKSVTDSSRPPSRPTAEDNTPPLGRFISSPLQGSDNTTLATGNPANPAYSTSTATYPVGHHGGGSTGQGPMSPSRSSQRHPSTDTRNYMWEPNMGYGYADAIPRFEGDLHGLENIHTDDGTLLANLSQDSGSNWASSASDSPYSTPTPDGPMIRGFTSPNAEYYLPSHAQYPSPQQPMYPPEFPTPFSEDPTGLYEFQTPAFPVRSPTPSTVTLSAQTAEHLVTLGHSVSSHPAVLGRRKASVALLSPYPGAGFPAAQALKPAQLNAIPRYLDLYWKRFDTLFPLVHRWSLKNTVDDTLRCAMAAVGSQFLQSEEDRSNGEILHSFVYGEVRRRLQWSVEVMQAILLCEFYSRFRGLRAAIRPSEPFQSLYSRMAISEPLGDYDNSVDASRRHWEGWIAAETRRRLHAACFVLDVHSSVYYELSPLHFLDPTTSIPLTKPSERLWTAQGQNAWETIIRSDPSALDSLTLADVEVTADLVAAAPPLDAAIYLASETLRLPRRSHPSTLDVSAELDLRSIERMLYMFPTSPVANTYLALHHTPLSDLLAVSGDSWVFTKKILDRNEFKRCKVSVHSWSSSAYAGVASMFAAKALRGFLDPDTDDEDDDDDEVTPNSHGQLENEWQRGIESNMSNISDYWALYTCALILWAVAQRPTRGGGSSAPTLASNPSGDGEDVEREAKAWLRMVASLSPENAMINVQGRREALRALSVVRKKLEDETIGRKSRLLVDAVRVLKSLEGDPDKPRF
ncbi:hypothetical protein GGS20DRAFT_245829 [Poronia punctata]|nr:hypothetical protein GGS20DRAFT_245829 [Poronia punctata]